jgi:recombination protein RecA
MSDAKEEKKKALQQAVQQIERQFGKGSIMKLGTETLGEKIPVISTGSLGLDVALGVGGVPRGRIVEIFGPEASGKTTLALHIMAEAQKKGGVAAFIDAEHAFDAAYARNLGVDIDNLLVSQPDTGEQALDIGETLVRSGAVDVIAVDSVAALVPKAEIEGEMGDSHMGLQARLMSQAMRKLAGTISKSKTCMVFINQIRMKIGIMFGNPETTPGGTALKFYSSVRLDIRRIASIKEGDRVLGSRTRVRVVKNKVAPPFRDAEFDIIYGKGISKTGELIDLGVNEKVLEKSGSWISYNNDRLGQGRDNAIEFLIQNQDISAEVEQKLKKKKKSRRKRKASSFVENITPLRWRLSNPTGLSRAVKALLRGSLIPLFGRRLGLQDQIKACRDRKPSPKLKPRKEDRIGIRFSLMVNLHSE